MAVALALPLKEFAPPSLTTGHHMRKVLLGRANSGLLDEVAIGSAS